MIRLIVSSTAAFRGRALAVALLVSLAGGAAAQDAGGRWPRAITLEQGTLLVYSPQVERFEGVTLSGRAAVSWEAKGTAPVFGVFWFDARVLLDKERRTVDVEALEVTKVRFPNATPEQEKRVADVIEAQIPKWDLTPSLDELQAAIATSERVKKSEQGISAKPPKLVFSYEPAVLLLYDGDPAVRPIPNAGLERVVNTPLFVVRDPDTKRFYLGSPTFWYEAADSKGPWKLVPEPTPKVKAFFDANPPPAPPRAAAEPAPGAAPAGQPSSGPAIQEVPPAAPPSAAPPPPPPGSPPPPPGSPQKPPAGAQPPPAGAQKQPAAQQKPERPPKVVVATQPTELIVFDGKPVWMPLGTDGKLLYADNTDGHVLVHVETNETYVLVSGRWFKAPSLSGPWTAVRPDRLPSAFRSIPPESGVGEVRTFVAGTDEARDAVSDAQIPQTTAVKRDQTIQVTYDGEPKFKQIEGTQIAYAVNTSFSVIQDSGMYWCCHQAVWYVAPAPKGPWTVSDRKPPSIDQIPPTAPVYNVRYVEVYQATPTVVYVGYLPGYVGVYPYYGSVVYGTGYYYPPYIGPVSCFPYPATFGVHMTFNPWTGFGVGVSYGTPFFSVGIHFGGYGRYYGPVGYRAPVRPVYGYRAPPVGYRAGYGGYRAPPPGYRRPAGGYPGGPRPTPYAGQRPYTGNIYDRPGNAERNAPVQQADRRGAAASAQPNNVYGDRNGDVYRQNQGGGWEKNTASGWQQAGAPQGRGASSAATSAPAGLSGDVAARGGAGGGGGYRGGGFGGARGGGGRR
jgi:hypothetical protein